MYSGIYTQNCGVVHNDVGIDQNYSQFFRPKQKFRSLEDGIEWVKRVGIEHKMVLVRGRSSITASGLRRAWLMCEKHGDPSNNNPKRCRCPFEIKCSEVAPGECKLRVLCGVHNHELERCTENCGVGKDQDYSQFFKVKQKFKSREEGVEWVQRVGREHMMVLAVGKSSVAGGLGKAWLMCEKHGNPSQTNPNRCGCPFEIKCYEVAPGEWKLRVLCGVHNHVFVCAVHSHELERCGKGHSVESGLEREQNEMIRAASKCPPKVIPMQLKKDDLMNSGSFWPAREHNELTRGLTSSVCQPTVLQEKDDLINSGSFRQGRGHDEFTRGLTASEYPPKVIPVQLKKDDLMNSGRFWPARDHNELARGLTASVGQPIAMPVLQKKDDLINSGSFRQVRGHNELTRGLTASMGQPMVMPVQLRKDELINSGSLRQVSEHNKLNRGLTASTGPPMAMLVQLKKDDLTNSGSLRQTENATQKAQVEGFECRTVVQQFRTQIGELKYFERHRTLEYSKGLSDLFFAHPKSLNLLKAFPYVLIMDATFKTNRYKMPFLEVRGVTSNMENFTAASAFVSGETEDNYLWVVNQFREMLHLVGASPTTIVTVTDMDLPLLNCLDKVFPYTKHILCRSHILQNVRDRCLKETSDEDDANAFVSDWRCVFEAKTEEAYHSKLALLVSGWSELPELVEYVKQTWLNMYKERIVSVWTDDVTHFGTNTTGLIGRAHLSLKQFLSTYGGGFDTIFTHLHSALEFQMKDRSYSLTISHMLVPFAPSKIKCFRMLLGCLSMKALEILVKEHYRATTRGLNVDSCACVLLKTHGLPCEHFITKYLTEGCEIEPDIIHKLWRTPYFGEDDDGYGAAANRKRYREWELQYFSKATPVKTFDGSTKMASLTGQGTSSSAKLAAAAGGQSLTPPIAPDIPKFMHGYIHKYVDVERDGHCGSSATAKSRGVEGFECRTVLQHFRTQIGELKYFERHRTLEDSKGLSDLFFAHPESLNLLKAFPYVLIMDATYKTNRYNMPFLEVRGVTSNMENFTAACAFMSGESEDNYLWVLNQVQEMLHLVGTSSTAIVTVTDMDLPLLNALDKVFPHTKHIICRSHILKNLRDKCLKETSDEDEANTFVLLWKSVFEATTKDMYHAHLQVIELRWRELPELIEYVKKTWLNMYKERIVSAWTDNVTHFGTHTTDMIGSEHSSVKQFLRRYFEGFDSIFTRLHSVLEFQIKQRNSALTVSSPLPVPFANTKIKCFRMLVDCLSIKALEILGNECYRATESCLSVHSRSCDCVLQKTHGLPCQHLIAKYLLEGRVIEPGIIHKFWRRPLFGENDNGDGAANSKRHRGSITRF